MYIVAGSGADISGTADQFRYLYMAGGTNCSIITEVLNMTTNSNSAAKAGVMIRNTLATNSAEVSITVTPANGVTWQYRTTTGGTTSGSRAAGLVAPYWVQLVRIGGTFTGYASANGVTWTQEFTVNITMANTVYIGLAVTSRNNSETCTANFGSIAVSGSIPTTPTGLTATAVATNQIDLNWTVSSGVISYDVMRATVSGGPYTTIATGVTATNYSDTGLATSTAYYYVVSAVDTGGVSANSAEAGTTTVPAAPMGLSASAVSTSQINLNWMASSGATSYNVFRSTSSGSETFLANVTSTSYPDTAVTAGAIYYYMVNAVDAGGESVNSAEVSAMTLLPPLTIGSVGGQMLVFWPASAGTNYTLQMTTNPATGPWVPVSIAVPQVAFTISNSAPEMFFRLQ
jgi:cellulose 1,4-beta-cellobiosidase